MPIASRTPEGMPHRCPVCRHQVRIEPSIPPGDAPCPVCGCLLWFAPEREKSTAPDLRRRDFSALMRRAEQTARRERLQLIAVAFLAYAALVQMMTALLECGGILSRMDREIYGTIGSAMLVIATIAMAFTDAWPETKRPFPS